MYYVSKYSLDIPTEVVRPIHIIVGIFFAIVGYKFSKVQGIEKWLKVSAYVIMVLGIIMAIYHTYLIIGSNS